MTNHSRKFWLVLIVAVSALVVVACSCGSILPTLQSAITQVAQPSPTTEIFPTVPVEPTIPPEPTVPPATEPPIAQVSPVGRWEDPDSNAPYSITTIEEQNGEYVVVSVTNSGRGDVNELTWSRYVNGVLTWEYCPAGMYCITSEFVSVTSDSLTANWYWSSETATGGTTVYRRLP